MQVEACMSSTSQKCNRGRLGEADRVVPLSNSTSHQIWSDLPATANLLICCRTISKTADLNRGAAPGCDLIHPDDGERRRGLSFITRIW